MRLIRKISIVILLILIFTNVCFSRGVNGGMNCAVCTVVTGILQQEAYLKGVSIFDAAKHFCKRLPIKIQIPCYDTIEKLEPFFTDKRVLSLFTPDVFCYALRSCHIDPGEKFCHLFPKPHTSFKKNYMQLETLMFDHGLQNILRSLHNLNTDYELYKRKFHIAEAHHLRNIYSTNTNLKENIADDKPLMDDNFINVDFCLMPILKEICDILLGTFVNLKPAIDIDGDGFSIIRSARGADWKGKDCSELDRNIYPGAQTHNLDEYLDANCNGIWGVDNVTGRPWEEVLCKNTESRGIIYLGDSVGAHFHFPEPWINPSIPNKSSIITKLEAILDELDWPEIGFATGYRNSSHPDIVKGSTDSIYLRMRAHNLCNHRDYQNLARNGAMSDNFLEEANAISRNPSDKPVLLIYAMVGNDVCNRYHDTVNQMTKPDELRKYVMEGLQVLDKKLPQKSHVILLSLLNASFIYPTMAERIHPLGSVFNNIQYKDLYTWFSCMEIGPCEGWMTGNATLRKITTQKAVELSQVLKSIASESRFESFQVHYLQNPFNMALDRWVAQGGMLYKLVDTVDSTHPNQMAQPLMAEALWESLEELGVLGPENPNNHKILELFGDQGGH